MALESGISELLLIPFIQALKKKKKVLLLGVTWFFTLSVYKTTKLIDPELTLLIAFSC